MTQLEMKDMVLDRRKIDDIENEKDQMDRERFLPFIKTLSNFNL